jgi:hypothetical protein
MARKNSKNTQAWVGIDLGDRELNVRPGSVRVTYKREKEGDQKKYRWSYYTNQGSIVKDAHVERVGSDSRGWDKLTVSYTFVNGNILYEATGRIHGLEVNWITKALSYK